MNHDINISYMNIVLVPMNEQYSEQYRILRNNPVIRKWFEYKEIISYEKQKEWYQKYIDNSKDYMFAILDQNLKFLGCNSIYNIDIKNKEAEYGRLIIDPQKKGNKYGYQATNAAVSIARDILDLSSLFLVVYSDNIAAIKVYKQVGFTMAGVTSDSEGKEMLKMVFQL